MKTKFTILSKLKPSFKGWVCIIVIFFFSPFICIFINHALKIDVGPLYTFGISDRKDFFTVWIALFGAIGIAFNIYQNQKRTKNQEEQLEKQQAQIDLQSKSQRDSRFSKGIELLGNENESARTGAAYSLYFLAKDYPDEFSKPVFDILCSHIRTLTTSEEYLKKHPTVSNEVQTILNLLFKDTDGNNTTPFSTYKANLSRANLEQVELERTNLKGANLIFTNLKNARLDRTNLEEADLKGASFESAFLEKVNFKRADLYNTNFDTFFVIDTDFEGACLLDAELSHSDLKEANLKGTSINSSMKTLLEQSGADLSGVNWVDDEEQTIITDEDSQ